MKSTHLRTPARARLNVTDLCVSLRPAVCEVGGVTVGARVVGWEPPLVFLGSVEHLAWSGWAQPSMVFQNTRPEGRVEGKGC